MELFYFYVWLEGLDGWDNRLVYTVNYGARTNNSFFPFFLLCLAPPPLRAPPPARACCSPTRACAAICLCELTQPPIVQPRPRPWLHLSPAALAPLALDSIRGSIGSGRAVSVSRSAGSGRPQLPPPLVVLAPPGLDLYPAGPDPPVLGYISSPLVPAMSMRARETTLTPSEWSECVWHLEGIFLAGDGSILVSANQTL